MNNNGTDNHGVLRIFLTGNILQVCAIVYFLYCIYYYDMYTFSMFYKK